MVYIKGAGLKVGVTLKKLGELACFSLIFAFLLSFILLVKLLVGFKIIYHLLFLVSGNWIFWVTSFFFWAGGEIVIFFLQK